MHSSKNIPIFNDNYYPLQYEHPSFQYYFQETFKEVDNGTAHPHVILCHLLDKYITLGKRNFQGKILIEQQALAQKMRETLDNLFFTNDHIKKAFKLLKDATIDPNDDLIWLLSAFCSAFPYVNYSLKNPDIKNALTIRDINDIYLENVIRKILPYHESGHPISNETADIALLAGQYESFLKLCASKLNISRSFAEKHELVHLDKMIQHATEAQMENIILPKILAMLNPEEESKIEATSVRLTNTLLHLNTMFPKLSKQAIETRVLPQLITLYQQKTLVPNLEEALLHCIDRMDSDALKQHLLPVLSSHYLDGKSIIHRKIALHPMLTIASKLSKEESDKVVLQIIPRVKDYYEWSAESFLRFLKELRKKQGYVNEDLFQTVNKIILDNNNAIFDNINAKESKKADITRLICSQLTREQVQQFFDKIPLAEVKPNMLSRFALLPEDIFPNALRMQVFNFVLQKRYEKDYMYTLIAYLKTNDLRDEASRTMLIDLFNIAALKTQDLTDYASVLEKGYFPLLETCVSLMTEKELIEHVIPTLQNNNIKDRKYNEAMHDTFLELFSKINDQNILAQYFVRFMKEYLNTYVSYCEDILPLICKKLNPSIHTYTTRYILKNDLSTMRFEAVAYVLTLIYNKNKEAYDNVPGICKSAIYQGASVDAKDKCMMM